MKRDPRPRRRLRLSALPTLLESAPAWLRIVAGLGLVLLGALMITRPLSSVILLGVYVGLSAIISGIAEVASRHSSATWVTRLFATAWILLGIAVLAFLGRSLDILPAVLAALLIVGGLASFGDALSGGTATERILAAAWGASQLVFGVLALAWPDVTVLLVAIVFGVRTIGFGGSLLFRAIRERARPSPLEEHTPAVGRRRAFVTGAARVALAVVLVVASGAAWAVNDWLDEGAPVVDSFYNPPDDVPTRHGMLIRSDDFAGRAPEGAEVRRILYTTRTALGEPAVASALVISPEDSLPGLRPVVAWNHGTTGVARGCAPSLREEAATAWMIPAVDDAIARGWVVVASDYSGQGAPGVFPYLIGVGEAQSTLDAVLAADQVEGIALSPEVAMWGHSQGGHAALWASQLAHDYTPELEIVGTAVLAPVADPHALAEAMVTGEPDALLSILTSWVLVPYADTYPDVNLTQYVLPGGRTIVREMTRRCPSEPGVIVSVAAALGLSEDQPLYTGDLTAGTLGRRLQENAAVGPWPSPLLVAWGDADEVVPPRLQEEFVASLCASGEQVRWVRYASYNHLEPLQPRSRFLPVLVNWTQARFLDRDTPVDDCIR